MASASSRPVSIERMSEYRRETDSLGVVEVPADKLRGAETQRAIEHFGIGRDLIPPELIVRPYVAGNK
jgi:fumarate hydratase class II